MDKFTKFPGIGPKQAARFAFYLLKEKEDRVISLAKDIENLKKEITFCQGCYFPLEDSANLCSICKNDGRDKKTVCVVEKEMDLVVIEKTGKYKGRYFVLGGLVDFYDAESEGRLRLKELAKHIKNLKDSGISDIEVILAISLNAEGSATMIFLEKMLKPLSVKITRLAQGLPRGAEMEYADAETLQNAMEGRHVV